MHKLKTLFACRRVRLFFAWVCGLIAVCGFAPVQIYALNAVGVFGLLALTANSGEKKESLLLGWLWGFGYFAAGLSWTYHSMHVYGGLPALLAAGAVLLLAAALALVTGAVTLLTAWFKADCVVRAAFVFPALWCLFEWVRGSALFGFGWLSTGYAYVDTLFAGWAPVLGVYGVGAVVVFVLGGIYALFSLRNNEKQVVFKGLLACWIGVLVVSTFAVDGFEWSRRGKSLQVRLVEPDLPVLVGARRGADEPRVERAAAMSERSALGAKLDLIVWPESVYVFPLGVQSAETLRAPEAVAAKTGAEVLFNGFYEPSRRMFFNALWLTAGEGTMRPVYAKRHLVPFGEFVPLGFRWFVDALSIPMADQQRGIVPPDGLKIAGADVALAVCYENMFGEELRAWWTEKSNPAFIIDTANLSWFAPFAADQFTDMSRMRARETARPLLQAVNASHSALITSRGKVDRMSSGGAQNLDLTLVLRQGEPTPFIRCGNAPAVLLSVLLLLAVGILSLLGRKSQTVSRKNAV